MKHLKFGEEWGQKDTQRNDDRWRIAINTLMSVGFQENLLRVSRNPNLGTFRISDHRCVYVHVYVYVDVYAPLTNLSQLIQIHK